MRGIDLPERGEDFTADPVELFFDLGYVLAFTQLVGHLVHHPDWVGVGEAALLFGLMWLPWSQFTWSANAVSGNGRAVRLLFLVGTAACVPMAASVSTAFGPGGPAFALSLGLIYLIALATMVLGLPKDSPVLRSILGFGSYNLVALVVLIAGAFLDREARILAWTIAAGIVIVAMIAAGRGQWIVRAGHFAERHGLIVIIALGEVIVAIGAPVVAALEGGEGVSTEALVALTASGAFAGMLWWAYFDRTAPALEHRAGQLETDAQKGRFARDVYTWAHAPIVAGIILAAAGLEEIALHPGDPVDLAFRAMLAGGLGLSVVGVLAAVWRAFRVWPVERLAAAIAIATLAGLNLDVSGLTLLLAVDAILLLSLIIEHRRVEG